jgi:hypothetical protein
MKTERYRKEIGAEKCGAVESSIQERRKWEKR